MCHCLRRALHTCISSSYEHHWELLCSSWWAVPPLKGCKELWMRLRWGGVEEISNAWISAAQDWLYGADAGEEVQVMTELPQGLRKEIALSINVPLFKRLSFFHTFPDHVLSSIASHMSPLQVPPRAPSMRRKGSPADSIAECAYTCWYFGLWAKAIIACYG